MYQPPEFIYMPVPKVVQVERTAGKDGVVQPFKTGRNFNESIRQFKESLKREGKLECDDRWKKDLTPEPRDPQMAKQFASVSARIGTFRSPRNLERLCITDTAKALKPYRAPRSMRKTVNIFDIKNKIQKEDDNHNIILEFMSAADAQTKRQIREFNELADDFSARERYVSKTFDIRHEEPTNHAQLSSELITSLMSQNHVEKVDPQSKLGAGKRKKKVLEAKVEELLLEQLDRSKVRKKFEKMTSLLGVTTRQYNAIVKFERFYTSRKNQGMNQLDKMSDIVLAKELFACWDEKRLGHIQAETLAENLISVGLAMSYQQVLKLIQALTFQKGQAQGNQESISLKEFVKIFEHDLFGERATQLIKRECFAEYQRQQKENEATK